MILDAHGTHWTFAPQRLYALRDVCVTAVGELCRRAVGGGAAVLRASMCLKRVFEAQIIIETKGILYDFERYFCAFQRERDQYKDITCVLKLFRDRPQIVTKKRKEIT